MISRKHTLAFLAAVLLARHRSTLGEAVFTVQPGPPQHENSDFLPMSEAMQCLV